MKRTVKPFAPFVPAAGLGRTARCCPGLPAVLLYFAIGSQCLAADRPPDILITRTGQEISCRILKLEEGKYLAAVENTVIGFPVSEVVEMRMGGESFPAETLIGLATTTFEATLGRSPVTFVAVAPLEIQNASPYPSWGTFYTDPTRYLAGHLEHSIPYTLRKVRIRFTFLTARGTLLGEQEYGYFHIKPGDPIPFAIDLTRPLARGEIETIAVRIVSFQSRAFKQKNYRLR